MSTLKKVISSSINQGAETKGFRIRRHKLNNESYKEMEMMVGTERVTFYADPSSTASQPAKKIALTELPTNGALEV